MLMLAIIFALTGVALGLRFKVLVLVPASGFAVASPILMNLAYSYSLRMQALAMITTVMALQIGYLLGIAIRLKVTPEWPRVTEGTSVGVFGLTDDAKDRLDAYNSRVEPLANRGPGHRRPAPLADRGCFARPPSLPADRAVSIGPIDRLPKSI